MQKIKIIVSGRVQGVGFRYSTLSAAQKLRINGKVWNNDDGSVSILAQSTDSQALAAFEKLIRSGFNAFYIRVDYVDVSTDNSPDFSDFQVLH